MSERATTNRRMMSEAEIRAIVEDAANKAAKAAVEQAAEEAVRRTLLTLGMSTAEPLELQKDMQHLREWRMAMGAAKRHGLFAIITILVSGLAGAVWLMVKGPSA